MLWPQACSGSQAFGFTTARQKSGTKVESTRRTWTALAKKLGNLWVMVLGTPIGSAPFVAEKLQSRVNDERRLWEAIPDIPDLQCAWQVLLQSANPRANHTAHSAASGTEGHVEHAKQVASLLMRLGGLGLRSATRCAAAAYWASWADALHMVDQRNPAVAERVEEALLGQGRATRRMFGPPPRGVSNLGTARIHREAQLGRPPQWQEDHPRVTLRRNQASGIVAGNIGRLLFLIRTSGRRPCCMAAPLLTGPTCGRTQDGEVAFATPDHRGSM